MSRRNKKNQRQNHNFVPYAFVMACNNKTENECFDLQLLGGPKSTRRHASEIKEGTPLILYNFQSNVCYLPITAKGPMIDNIHPEAWHGKFPCQVSCGKG